MKTILLACVLLASPAWAQPSTPCTPQSSTTYTTNDTIYMWRCASDGQSWVAVTYGGGSAGGGVPTGAIIFIDAGTCPAGYAEVSALNGKTIIGTVAANKDVGTTGGADAITPAGNNSAPTFTGNAFSSVISHTHTVTVNDPGHVHPEGYRNTGTAGTLGVQGASTANNASIAGGVLSATTGITATTANPAGGVASITPTGSVSAPTFAGTPFDNRSAFIRLIACRKT